MARPGAEDLHRLSAVIRVKVDSPSFHGFAEEVLEQLRPTAEDLVREGVRDLHARINRKLSRQGDPVAGGPPATVTGALRRSLKITAVVWKGKYKVQADVEIAPDSEGGQYAGRLEYGGRAPAKAGGEPTKYLPPHPYIRPAEAEFGVEFRARVAEALP